MAVFDCLVEARGVVKMARYSLFCKDARCFFPPFLLVIIAEMEGENEKVGPIAKNNVLQLANRKRTL